MFARPGFFLLILLALSIKLYSQGCVIQQGVLTGSNICKGLSATLTFTTSVGTGPYILVYTNGTSRFTQTNVQSGIPFSSPDIPSSNTTYTLVSIQDASGCAPTNVQGLSVGADLIINGNFSGGNTGFISNYAYSNSGLPPAVYFIGTDPVAWNAGMASCHDHTTGTGNMMLINGADVPNVTVWTETIPVTPNTNYQFSTWIENISTINPAQLQFSINSVPIGNIFQANNASCVWDQFYTTWNSGSSTTATISILNENTSFSGNDFSLDDIHFAPITALNNSTTIQVMPAPNGDFSFTQNLCNPAQVQFGGISQPGVGYIWNINGTDQPAAAPGDPTLSYTFPIFGIYPVTLKVAGACSGSVSKTIAIQVQPADIIITPDTPVCLGRSVPLKTRAALDFCWQPASYLDNPASPNPVATPPVTTKYYFTAKTTGGNLIVNGDFEAGNMGFSSVYTYMSSGLPEGVYFVGTSPHTWNSNAPVSCGDHTSGTGNMMIINGATTAGVNVWTTGAISVIPNTNYAFSVWIQSVSPISPAILQFSINGTSLGNPVNASSNTCSWNQFYTTWNSGSSTTASISLVNKNIAPTGNDFALDDISFAPVTVQIDSVTINVETPVVIASPDTTVCLGNPVPLHATGSLNYTWSPAAGLSSAGIANPVAIPSISTDYIVTGTSARGCVASDTVNVAVYPRLLTIGADTSICLGDPARLYAAGGVIYNWSPAQYLDNPAIASPLARPDRTTRFLLGITDGNQCPETDSVTITVRPVPVFKAPPDQDICYGFGVTLSSANSGHYIYVWSPATGLDDPAAPYPLAHPDASITYSLQISDSVCSAYDSSFTVKVTVKPLPLVTAEKDNDIDCAIHTAQLRSDGGVFYTWTPATGLNDPLLPNPIASIDSTTTYIVKGTGANGCYAFDTLTVNVTATGANLFVVPNAFTPNGDGHNDCFGVIRWGDVQLEELDIFNRWGQRIFSTRNPSDCWDGTFKGKPQQAGGYAYVIRAHSFCGEITHTGIVMLIR